MWSLKNFWNFHLKGDDFTTIENTFNLLGPQPYSKIEILDALNRIYEICQAISSHNIEIIHFSIFSKYKTAELFLWIYYSKLNI